MTIDLTFNENNNILTVISNKGSTIEKSYKVETYSFVSSLALRALGNSFVEYNGRYIKRDKLFREVAYTSTCEVMETVPFRVVKHHANSNLNADDDSAKRLKNQLQNIKTFMFNVSHNAVNYISEGNDKKDAQKWFFNEVHSVACPEIHNSWRETYLHNQFIKNKELDLSGGTLYRFFPALAAIKTTIKSRNGSYEVPEKSKIKVSLVQRMKVWTKDILKTAASSTALLIASAAALAIIVSTVATLTLLASAATLAMMGTVLLTSPIWIPGLLIANKVGNTQRFTAHSLPFPMSR